MKVGDKVKFLNDTGGGVITRFLEPGKVLVKIEEGFEIPTLISDLVPDQGIEDRPQAAVHSGKDYKEVSVDHEKEAPGYEAEQPNSDMVYFSVNPTGNPYLYRIFLINDTSYHIHYVIGERRMTQDLFRHAGMLEANTKMYIDDLKFSDPDAVMTWFVQYVSFRKGFFEKRYPVDCQFEFSGSGLMRGEYLKENDFFDEEVSLFPLMDYQNLYRESFDKRLSEPAGENSSPAPARDMSMT